MIEVSYYKFKLLEKLLSIHLLYKDYFLWRLVLWFIPSDWNDIYTFPYYYKVTEKHCPDLIKEYLPVIGKRIKLNNYGVDGILKGFAVTVEDYYYIIEDEHSSELWDTFIDTFKIL